MKTANIEVTRGDTVPLVFRLTENGQAVDLTGWSAFTLTIDPSATPTDNTNNVESIVGASLGGGRVSFGPSGTTPPGRYFYDAQALDSATKKRTFARGAFVVAQDITKI